MAEQVVRVCQGDGIVEPPGRRQRGPGGRHVGPPAAAPVEERAGRPGDLPGVSVKAVGLGVADQRPQHRDLGVEPGHGLVLIRHVGGQHAVLRRGEPQRRTERAEPLRGRHGRVQVVVEHPVDRGAAVRLRVLPLGLIDGVEAKQVVEREPAGQVLGDHMRPGQLTERGACLRPRYSAQAGRRRQRDIRARVQAEQPEHARAGLAQLVVGPGEHGAHIGDRIVRLQRVQPAPDVAQFGGQLGQRTLRPAGRAADRDAQGQRQPGAVLDDLRRRLGLGRDPVPAEPAGQHLVRLRRAEHLERERPGSLGGHQPGQLVAAGHQDQRAGRAGQQRAHLGHVARVVEHDQHRRAVQQAAVQGRPALGVGRDPVRRHAEGVQEEPQHLPRFQRRGSRVQAAQVDVQLAAGEALGDLMAEAQRQRGLAHPGRPGDDDNRH